MQPKSFDPSSQVTITQGLQPSISPPATLNAAELFAKLQAKLEQARAEYALRHLDSVRSLLDEIEKSLPGPNAAAVLPVGQNDFGLLEASLHTLRGRLLRQTDQSNAAFQRALSLFAKFAQPVAETPGFFARITSFLLSNPEQTQTLNVRIYTDYGIALFRVYRFDEAIRILNAVCKSGAPPAEAVAYLGYAEMNRKELGSAESRLRTAMQLSPSNPTVSYWLAHVLRMQGKRKEACSQFCDTAIAAWNLEDFWSAGKYALWALHMNRDSDTALRLAAMAYRLSNHSTLAFRVIDKYIKYQPSNISALAWKGVLLRDCDRLEESVQALQAIEVRDPGDAWILGELVQSLLFTDRAGSDETLAAATKAVQLAPDDPFLLRVLGRVRIQRRDFDLAAESLREADRLAPGQEDLSIELGDVFLRSNNIDAALEQWLKAANQYPRSAPVQFGLGLCYERLSDRQKALAHYRRACRLDRDYEEPFVQMLNLLLEQGQKEEVMEEIELHLSGSLSYIALWQKASLQSESEQWNEAVESLSASVAAARKAGVLENRPEILLDLGEAFRQLGRYEEAKGAYDSAMEIVGERPDVLVALARYFCDLADFEKALGTVQRGIENSPRDSSLWNLQGWCLQHLGKPDEAREAYKNAVEFSDGKDPWSLKGLANVLLDFDPNEARRIFLHLLGEQKYQSNAEQSSGRTSPTSSLLGFLGWCNYRLGRYEEAIRLYQSSVSQNVDKVPDLFDLGLTFFANGRVELAQQTYRKAFEFAKQGATARLRSQYYVALYDLIDAFRHKIIGHEAESTIRELTQGLSGTGIAIEQLTWLQGFQEHAPAS